MTTDDMREIEAALDEFQDASERVYEANPDPAFGDPLQRQKDARGDLLALIRQKLPQTDAEHGRAVEAWRKEAMSYPHPPSSVGFFMVTSKDIDEALRLMRARTSP